MTYDIFISYKRISKQFAYNLYNKLLMRGYHVFLDLEEMGRDRFDTQIFEYIDNAKDIFVILEEGSLQSIFTDSYQDDWFCKEIAYAIKENKNIIPVLIDGYEMPDSNVFPKELSRLTLINSLPFGGLSYFDEYLDKLKTKGYLNSKKKATDFFQMALLAGDISAAEDLLELESEYK